MKIISKFKDFYDSAGEIDYSFNWIRGEPVESPNCVHVGYGLRDSDRFSHHQARKSIVCFCGKMYPFLTALSEYGDPIEYIYDKEKIAACLEEENKKMKFLRWDSKGEPQRFTGLYGKDCININMEFKTPIVLLEQKVLTVNPNLSLINFGKAVGPYDARQRIEQFLRNDLACENKILETPSDKVKIQAHGFDQKTSFRKDTPPTRKQ